MIKAYFIGGPLDLTSKMLETPQSNYSVFSTPNLLEPISDGNRISPTAQLSAIVHQYRQISHLRQVEGISSDVYVYALII